MKKRNDKLIYSKLHDDALLVDEKFKVQLKQHLFAEKRTTMPNKQQLKLKQLMKQKSFIYAGGLSLLLLLVTSVFALNNRSQNLARQSIIDDNVALPKNLENLLGIDNMTTLAQAYAPPGASVVGVEAENENGKVLYKVKFSDGSFRLFDAVTGLAYDDNSDDTEIDESVPAGFVAGITVQQARDIADAQRLGKTITKIELEVEDGIVVYSVRFADDGRVDVNATDGSVVRVKDGGDSKNEDTSNEDSDDSVDSEDHEEEDIEDDGDRSGSDSSSERSGSN